MTVEFEEEKTDIQQDFAAIQLNQNHHHSVMIIVVISFLIATIFMARQMLFTNLEPQIIDVATTNE
ncbi:hypothetical protein KW782_04105 [Candidatus Parcubacteria bacterium]|nr:hypothetical protein [Candidatus Parcubacteria bacterium]